MDAKEEEEVGGGAAVGGGIDIRLDRRRETSTSTSTRLNVCISKGRINKGLSRREGKGKSAQTAKQVAESAL